MATVSRCFTPVLGKKIRVTLLNEDGTVPVSGTEDVVLVTSGFIEVDLSSEIEAGDEIIQKNASGALCVNEMQPSAFKRFTVEIDFCGVNPYLLTMISGCEVYLDANGTVVGFTQPEGEIVTKFALELWTGLTGTKTASGYFLLPLVNGGTLDDIKINGKDTIDFTIKGAYTMGGNSWGEGPFEVIEGAGTNEVQTVAVTGTPTGGTFKLSTVAGVTPTIQYNSTAADAQTALETVLGEGNVSVTGGPLPGTALVVHFEGQYGSQPVTAMTINTPSFTGGTTPAATVTETTPGVAGEAAVLPTALDPFDHMLCMVTDVLAPDEDCSPAAMPALA